LQAVFQWVDGQAGRSEAIRNMFKAKWWFNTETELFECDACRDVFTKIAKVSTKTIAEMLDHMLTHSKCRVDVCPHCLRGFKSTKRLAQHNIDVHEYAKSDTGASDLSSELTRDDSQLYLETILATPRGSSTPKRPSAAQPSVVKEVLDKILDVLLKINEKLHPPAEKVLIFWHCL